MLTVSFASDTQDHLPSWPLPPEKVLILTADGRTLTGTLLSCDQVTNLVLSQTVERIIRPAHDEEASVEVSHGLYLIRGENVAICGLVDEELDARIDWAKVRGDVVGGIKHVWGPEKGNREPENQFCNGPVVLSRPDQELKSRTWDWENNNP